MCIRLSALITSCTGISWFLAKKPARSISMCETWLLRIWFDCCTHCINTLVCILCSCESYTYTYTSSQRPRECLCCMSNVTPVATKFGPGQLKVNTCEMNDTRWDNMVQQLQRLFYRSVYIYIVYINIIYIYMYIYVQYFYDGSATSHPCSCSFKYHQANTSSQSTCFSLSWCIQCILLPIYPKISLEIPVTSSCWCICWATGCDGWWFWHARCTLTAHKCLSTSGKDMLRIAEESKNWLTLCNIRITSSQYYQYCSYNLTDLTAQVEYDLSSPDQLLDLGRGLPKSGSS